MHTDSNTGLQNLIPAITSNVSSNRIKIQEILLILQSETDYFSKLFISESAPFEAVTLQSSQRLPELLFYTKKSYKILQAPIPAPILHVHITLQSREFSIQNPILHAEGKELFDYYYYIPEGKETFIPEILRIEGKEIF